jgi:hypothetical protein
LAKVWLEWKSPSFGCARMPCATIPLRQLLRAADRAQDFKRKLKRRELGAPSMFRSSGRTDGQTSKAQVMLPLTPWSRHPMHYLKDRRRNVAAVRRAARISGEFAESLRPYAWQRGVAALPNGTCKNRQKLPLSFVYSCSERLTETAAEPYIGPLGCAAASARWRVREAPHCLHGDRASGHARGHVRVTASNARGLGLFDK